MSKQEQKFVAKNSATESYWVRNDGWTATTFGEASQLTKREVENLYWSFPRAKIKAEAIEAL